LWSIAVWALAWIGTVSLLSLRAVEHAVPGIWTGADPWINAGRVLGAFCAQLFGICGITVAALACIRLATSDRKGALRASSIGVALMLALAVLITSGAIAAAARGLLSERIGNRLPLESELVLSLTVSAFAIGVAIDAMPERVLRGAALVLVGAGAVSLAHAAMAAMQAFGSADDARPSSGARIVATAEWGLQALLVIAALAWIATALSPRRTLPGWQRRLQGGVAGLLALLVSTYGSYLAIRGLSPEAPRLALFTARVLEQFLDPLAPYVSFSLRAYVELLRWSVAITSLLLIPRGMVRSTAVALALLASGHTLAPLGALALALATWSVALAVVEPELRSDTGSELSPLAPARAAD
jgi:hypothetical protein